MSLNPTIFNNGLYTTLLFFRGRTVSSLPGNPQVGMVATVLDSTTAVPGAVVTGGGTNKVIVMYNDTNWVVTGGGGVSSNLVKDVPSSGDTITLPTGFSNTSLIIVPAASILLLTVVMPSAPVDQSVVELSTTQYINSLTVNAAVGNTIQNGAVGSLGAGGGKSWRFSAADNTWYARY